MAKKKSTAKSSVVKKSSAKINKSSKNVYVALKPVMPSGFTALQRARLREYEKSIFGGQNNSNTQIPTSFDAL